MMKINNKTTRKQTIQNFKNTDIKSKKIKTKNKVIMTICIIVIALCILLTAYLVLFNTRIFSKSGDNKLDNNILTPVSIKKKQMNFLIVGVDHIKAQEGKRAGTLTDVIMIANYDIENKNVNIIQIPRDTYIGDDYPTGKINAIYGRKTDGGIQGIANRINKMFNIPIDHYVILDLDGLTALVDAIGGVTMDVPVSFTGGDNIKIEKGVQKVNGKQAEAIVRERHSYANADLGRIQTQRLFMNATMKKVFSLGKLQIIKLAPSMIKQVETDFTLNELLSLYGNIIDGAKDNITFHDLPIKSARKNNLSMISLKKTEMAELLNTYFRPHSNPVPAEQLGIIELN